MNRRDVLYAAAAGAVVRQPMVAPFTTPTDDLAEATLAHASRRIRRRTVTCRDLTLACLERIAGENPRINAVITVMRDQALAAAAVLDAEALRGRFRSALHGIPIVLKDAIDTAGTRTTAGSAVYQDRIPTEDAFVVRRLKEAGAVVLGKANLAEFSLSATGVSSHFGPVKNPWALDRVSGGSSSGSAAAVATGMCFGALGTDSGGSVRLPAAWCGVVGLKPTSGLVPNSGIIPSVATLDCCGPIARTVEDVALILGSIVGYDPIDWQSIDRPAEDYALSRRLPVKQLRVGIPRKGFFDGVEPAMARLVEAALGAIAKLVHSVKEVTLPPESGSHDIVINLAEIVSYHRKLLEQQADRYTPGTRRVLQWCRGYLDDPAQGQASAKMARYVEARAGIERLRRTIGATFTDYDVLVLPTMKGLPPTIEAAREYEANAGVEDAPLVSIDNTLTFNRLGLPALTVPCGYTAEGLPVGLMIAGPRYSEGTLLSLGAAYERSSEWHTRRPPRST